MSYSITGTVAYIGDTQQVSEKFSKRSLALQVADGNFTETPSFEFVQDKTALLDNLTEGQEVTVHFNIRGREYQPKAGGRGFFTSLQGWKVEDAGALTGRENIAAGAGKTPGVQKNAQGGSRPAPITSNEDSDLPF